MRVRAQGRTGAGQRKLGRAGMAETGQRRCMAGQGRAGQGSGMGRVGRRAEHVVNVTGQGTGQMQGSGWQGRAGQGRAGQGRGRAGQKMAGQWKR